MGTEFHVDLTGQRFGRWTVIERAPKNYYHITERPDGSKLYNSIPRWRCRCDCGNERLVLGQNLVKGMSKSCGCLQRELLRERNAARRKHEQ